VSSEIAGAVLAFLAPFLKPMGDYTRNHVESSKGRGRARKKSKQTHNRDVSEPELRVAIPSSSQHLRIGFNSNIRRLEELAHRSKSESPAKQTVTAPASEASSNFPAVMFVYRAAIPEPVSHSIPLLVAAASASSPEQEPIRLVELSANAEAELSTTLGIPRVSVLGVDDGAPEAGPLIQYVRSQLEPVRAPWLGKCPTTSYLPLKLNISEVSIGGKKLPRKREAEFG
jgi:ribonuclease P/MRP protein subunit POP3